MIYCLLHHKITMTWLHPGNTNFTKVSLKFCKCEISIKITSNNFYPNSWIGYGPSEVISQRSDKDSFDISYVTSYFFPLNFNMSTHDAKRKTNACPLIEVPVEFSTKSYGWITRVLCTGWDAHMTSKGTHKYIVYRVIHRS